MVHFLQILVSRLWPFFVGLVLDQGLGPFCFCFCFFGDPPKEGLAAYVQIVDCRSPIQNSSPFGLWLAQFWTRPNPNTIYYFCANEYLITQSLKGSVSTVSYYKRVVSRQAMQVFARKVHIHSIHSHTLFRKIDLRFYSICWSIEVIAHIWFHQGQENNINITQFTRIHTQGAQLFTSFFCRSLLRNE